MYCLIDCNNFYVSCERVFNPKIKKLPVIVLSNNDGCIISRSNEAKKLGIPMGAPVFKWSDVLKKNNVKIFSSNYTLYGDMSARVMEVIENYLPETEIYSIDECFGKLENMNHIDINGFLAELKKKIFKWTGIPVSVGIGKTKTLAKLANKIAKKENCNGVFKIDENNISGILSKTDVADIWGIGRKSARKLYERGIRYASELLLKDRVFIRNILKLSGLKTVMELQEVSCIELDECNVPKKNIVCSRSFGKSVSDLNSIKESVAVYAEKAAEKLREQNTAASYISVFITTKRFSDSNDLSNSRIHYDSVTAGLCPPTAFTPEIIRTALKLVEKIYLPGYKYKKTGVMLSGITKIEDTSMSLFEPENDYNSKKKKLMECVDSINSKYNRTIIKTAVCGMKNNWLMKRTLLSPNFTTDINALLKVR